MQLNNEQRKRAEARSLSRIGYYILKKGQLDVEWLPDGHKELGFTNGSEQKVYIAWNHAIYMQKLTSVQKTVLRKGIFAHELLHQLLTNFSYTEEILNSFKSRVEQQVFMLFANTLEDPAIEYHAPYVFGGDLYNALRFMIAHVYKNSPSIDESENAFTQLINALIQFGDMGIVKGSFTYPEADKYFRKVVPKYYKGIISPNGVKRLDIARECMEITRPLWEKEMQEQLNFESFLEKLLEDLFSSMEDAGLDIEIDIDEDSLMPMETDAAKRREEFAKSISDSLIDEENQGNENKAEESSVSDYSVENEEDNLSNGVDSEENDSVKDYNQSTDTADNVSASNDEDETSFTKTFAENQKENISTNDESIKNESMDEKCNNKELSNYNPETSDNLNLKDSSDLEKNDNLNSDIPDITMPEAEANVLADEEYVISEDMLDKIEKELLSEHEKEEFSKKNEENDFEIQNYNVSSPRFKNAKCLNRTVSLGNPERTIETYKLYVSSLEAQIKPLFKAFKRILSQDRTEYRRHTSGQYNIIRGASATTARMFDRRKENDAIDDFSVLIMVDQSGSMDGQKILEARKTCIILTEVLSRLKIPLYIIGFNSGREGYDAVHDHYVRWKGTLAEKASLIIMQAGGCNFDGYSIRYAGEVIKRRKSAKKIIFILSDGTPAAKMYKNRTVGIADTKDAIRDVRKDSIVFGIGIGNDCSPETLMHMYGKDFIHIKRDSDLTNVISKKLKDLIEKEY